MKRAQKQSILNDLNKKLVLLVGPRQSGKTWLAKDIAREFKNSIYLNYDQLMDRKIMLNQAWLDTTDLLILDELHKMPDWKNFLKGVYDTKPEHSLVPISLAELTQVSESISIDNLIERGGFPEPYFAENEIDADRWRLQYINSLLSTDVFELDAIQNIKAMKLVFELLRSRVGSPVSYQSLAEDVAVSPVTIKKYIQILEALFIVFSVTPYSKNIARSLLKEPKIYFYDTGLVQGDDGVKLENLVAISLLKHALGKTDSLGQETALHYLRTKEGVEVDFALASAGVLEMMIEVKLSDVTPAKSLIKFSEKYGYPACQIVKSLRNEYQQKGVRILKAEQFLSDLFL